MHSEDENETCSFEAEFSDYLDDSGIEEPVNTSRESDEEKHFKVLSTKEIIENMEDKIKEINTFSKLSHTILRALLNYLKWNTSELTDRLFDDPEKLFKDAQVVNPTNIQVDSKELPTPAENGSKECVICCTDTEISKMIELICGHQFCENCWSEYLTNKIMEEGCGQRITCAGHKCDLLVDDEIIMRLIDDNVKVRYQLLITNSFVECSKHLTWCPAPGCNYVIQVNISECCEITCNCGRVFCFACSEIWHEPIDCILFKKWLKKCADDSETSNWIVKNTKDCPKCYVNIEKNGGCNHMVCTKGSCKFHFCWVCLGDWNLHKDYYKCNRYEKDTSTTKTDNRRAMERYLHFYKRYMSHVESLKLEEALPESIEEKVTQMLQIHNMRYLDVGFASTAVAVLRQCRETLMMTYAFAYYLEQSDNNSVIFEDNQSYLEKATEDLSKYLERKVTSEKIIELKETIMDKFIYCEKRRKKLLEHVHEGYDESWWQFNE